MQTKVVIQRLSVTNKPGWVTQLKYKKADDPPGTDKQAIFLQVQETFGDLKGEVVELLTFVKTSIAGGVERINQGNWRVPETRRSAIGYDRLMDQLQKSSGEDNREQGSDQVNDIARCGEAASRRLNIDSRNLKFLYSRQKGSSRLLQIASGLSKPSSSSFEETPRLLIPVTKQLLFTTVAAEPVPASPDTH
jgi:hypothetical protein